MLKEIVQAQTAGLNREIQVIDQRELLGKDFKIYGDIENTLFLAKDVAEWIDYSKRTDGSYQVG